MNKIDKCFVRDMLVNDRERVLVETIIAMAHKLGHELVAEGIEEQAQSGTLRSLGCEIGQGYLFARPMSGDAFTTLLVEMRRGSTVD